MNKKIIEILLKRLKTNFSIKYNKTDKSSNKDIH